MSLELKICGLTTLADMRLCEALGADFVGMVVEVPRSPRSISRHTASYLTQAARAQPVIVVVADWPAQQITEIAERCSPAAIQVHGGDDPRQVEELRQRLPDEIQLWRALGLPADCADSQATAPELIEQIKQCAQAGIARIVLDTRVKGQVGGTGIPSHWPTAAQIIKHSPLPVMLAGGLGPENVADAVSQTQPAGVDISSGVESRPGRKDPVKLEKLSQAVGKV